MSDSSPAPERKRKRPRAARACELCRAKKYRCDEMDPCGHCKRLKVDCIYQGANQVRERLAGRTSSVDIANSDATTVITRSFLAEDSGSTVPAPIPQLMDRNKSQFRRPSGQSQPQAPQRDVILDNDSAEDDEHEVNELNIHTHNTEFHGPTSTLAFLTSLQDRSEAVPSLLGGTSDEQTSLVSTFHNSAFSPNSNVQHAAEDTLFQTERYYFRQAQLFIDAYFQTLHAMHPIVSRSEFLSRCEDLWFEKSSKASRSFIALYYSILSLGAIVREWDEELLDGLGRFQWSRKLFQYATIALGVPRATNDLETVQAFMFMAKICQNELNPHLAYMYLGMATRSALSAGHNRQPKQKVLHGSRNLAEAISKTWWGLYSLEIEMSFSLGRPDSLGPDEYHNRELPPLDDTETAMIPVMVYFTRIIRKVSMSVYLSGSSLQERAAKAYQLESEMDEWMNSLPDRIRPQFADDQDHINRARDPKWAKRQRLVLELRYLNVKMVLYRPFLLCVVRNPQRLQGGLDTAVAKCVTAARRTIEVMHRTYCNHNFFRTWWYNTTYTTYAASIILCYASRIAHREELADLIAVANLSVEILEAMSESVVATKVAALLRKATVQISESRKAVATPLGFESINNPGFSGQVQLGPSYMNSGGVPPSIAFSSPGEDFDLSFMETLLPFDDAQMNLWTGFNTSLNDFDT